VDSAFNVLKGFIEFSSNIFYHIPVIAQLQCCAIGNLPVSITKPYNSPPAPFHLYFFIRQTGVTQNTSSLFSATQTPGQ
ncbi:MAG TPA: hypothetical protein VLF09_09720, partial [Cellvibrio sp.]|nr:hypothetical protein [Cellvibrio sp.]